MRRSVTIDETRYFETDDTGQLFWKGQLLVTEHQLVVPMAVNVAIVFTALATAGMCIVMWLDYFRPMP